MFNNTTFIANRERVFSINDDGNDSFQSLINLFPPGKDEQYWSLNQCIRQLDFDFYHDLLPHIAQWASEHSQAKCVEPLYAGKDGIIVYTAVQVRYILANAFFLNTTAGFGSIDLYRLYTDTYDRVAIERIRCLIEYFRLSLLEKNHDRQISIERYCYKDQLPDWTQQNIRIQSSKLNIFTTRMEDAHEAQGFVDFANKHIHIHRIISSATQEEVLFSCCPEAFLSILVCETLQDDEIVLLRGCKRYVDYTGYLDNFAYKSPYHEQNPSCIQDILVIDACYMGQFTLTNIDRDLGKAWTAFDRSKNESIVTGNWGCGVFGGDPVFKFLQQICAAMIIGDRFKRLDYSVYGNENLAQKLKLIAEQLDKNEKTVADIYQMMVKYRENGSKIITAADFNIYFDRWLNI